MASPVDSAERILSSEAVAKKLSPGDLEFLPGFRLTALYGHDEHAVPVAVFEHVAPGATTVPAATTNPSQSRNVNPWRESSVTAAREVIDHQ